MSGDKNLKKHVLNSSKNATYMSPIIQNEMIQTCSDILTEKVIDRISKAEYYSLLGDETMDVSGTGTSIFHIYKLLFFVKILSDSSQSMISLLKILRKLFCSDVMSSISI